MDRDIQTVELGNRKFFQYISFQNSDEQAKLGSLHINDINNVKIRYEFITQTDIEDKVILNRKVGLLRDIILSVKYVQCPLFIGIE